MKSDWRKWLFTIAAIYDGLFGLIFFFSWRDVYRHFNVMPPNHEGYVKFPALLLIIFGAMFLQIARDPDRNRNLIAYGIALKVVLDLSLGSGGGFFDEPEAAAVGQGRGCQGEKREERGGDAAGEGRHG